VWVHGDRYLRDVDPDDVPHLYRCGSLLAQGVPVGGSTDAPFGPADPWLAIRAATERRTRTGAAVGADEALGPARALELFLSPPDAPGAAPRRVCAGAPGDLVLLDAPLEVALDQPSADRVRATWIAGVLRHGDV
jgi:predicted amidohydrolase YtcJ